MKVSFVIPCYCSHESILSVVEEIERIILSITHEYEIILVNDCSPDNTWKIISDLAKKKCYIKAINLSRNSGQHAAILAGFRYVTGDIITVLDDDGQTPIDNLFTMIDLIKRDYDVVSARYIDRSRKSLFRDIGSKLNMMMSEWLIERPKGVIVSVFFVAKRFVIDEVIKYNQPYPYVEGLILRVTHNVMTLEMNQRSRMSGHSGYSLKKLFGLWLNGFTSFSIKPLRLTTYIGSIVALGGMLFAAITIIRKIVGSNVQIGWSSLMTAILVIGGCILIVLGLIGEYLGRIYLSINNTPQSVVKETIGIDE